MLYFELRKTNNNVLSAINGVYCFCYMFSHIRQRITSFKL